MPRQADLLSAVNKAVGDLVTAGQNDLPADPAVVAEVEVVQRELEQAVADHESALARLRSAAVKADALPGMYKSRHDGDERRLEGERGGVHREMKADVSYAQSDT
ncbi:hypothetical protein C1I95_14855 [Micromonospora craterilacus]|uniref:Uncharacterized protein n=2 Tax=Micromonospora craterilacus TaxID=1655439 RepID=A0A2W2EML0_9ACTN|nr:hypothetical protein C1I95_14855 [Micromonospora craterilacus]